MELLSLRLVWDEFFLCLCGKATARSRAKIGLLDLWPSVSQGANAARTCAWSVSEISSQILHNGRELNPGDGKDRQWDTLILPLSYHGWLFGVVAGEMADIVIHSTITHWCNIQYSTTSNHRILSATGPQTLAIPLLNLLGGEGVTLY